MWNVNQNVDDDDGGKKAKKKKWKITTSDTNNWITKWGSEK